VIAAARWCRYVGHQIGRKKRRTLLPPALVCKYEPDSFWRDPARNPNNVTVI